MVDVADDASIGYAVLKRTKYSTLVPETLGPDRYQDETAQHKM